MLALFGHRQSGGAVALGTVPQSQLSTHTPGAGGGGHARRATATAPVGEPVRRVKGEEKDRGRRYRSAGTETNRLSNHQGAGPGGEVPRGAGGQRGQVSGGVLVAGRAEQMSVESTSGIGRRAPYAVSGAAGYWPALPHVALDAVRERPFLAGNALRTPCHGAGPQGRGSGQP